MTSSGGRRHRHAPLDARAYWSLPVPDVLSGLHASKDGLASGDAEARLAAHGENRLHGGADHPLRDALRSQLRNPLLWLLAVAALTDLLMGARTEAALVIAVLLFGTALSVVQETRAGHAVRHLRDLIALKTRVVRGGSEVEVPASAVVPGDVLVLAAGSMVPADALLLETRELYVSEAALTGEPYAVAKESGVVGEDAPVGARTNVVHMGTNVRSGTGRALVVRTGADTELGQVSRLLVARAPDTEFQRGLRSFGHLLLRVMVVLVFLVFAAAAVQEHPAMDSFLFAVALAVGLAPEMLPAVLSSMLSRGARRMASRGVLVRRLEAIENLGNMDVLCVDKTGTLTEGEIEVQEVVDLDGAPSERVRTLAYWNASLQAGMANPIDRAIARTGPIDLPRKLDEIPFDFSRKRLSVLVEPTGQPATLITKGAVEPVLEACSGFRAADGSSELLDEAARARYRARAARWADDGIRAIALASRPCSPERPLSPNDEHGLVLEGFVTLRDPLKAGVADTIRGLARRGVALKIVSGDHRGVVGHVAEQIGSESLEVMTGPQVSLLRDDALQAAVERVDLFAEVEPAQKERIVAALMRAGHVVGFMGDGINDAPAIHTADVGVSVDGATDVAREAADFVLLQRDLQILCDGIDEGRRTFANTLKYVTTTESANLGNMISMAAATIFLPFLPLLAHQVLLNNLLSDVPSATLGADEVDPERLDRPLRWDTGFIRRFMVAFGLISALFDALTFVVLRLGFDLSPNAFRTAWFVESLLTELLVLLVLRTRRRFWQSTPHRALVWSTVAVITALGALPFLPIWPLLGFVELDASIWAAMFGIAIAYITVVEAAKPWIFRHIDRRPAVRSPGAGGSLRLS